MIDLKIENIVTFAQAARLVPAGGVHRATIANWARIGVRGIHLEHEIIAGRTYTSAEALDRFLAACRERRWAGIQSGEWYELALAAKEQLENGSKDEDKDSAL